MFVFPVFKSIRPRLQYSNYSNLMEIPTDIDMLKERKAKNCRKKLNKGERNSAIGRKQKKSRQNPRYQCDAQSKTSIFGVTSCSGHICPTIFVSKNKPTEAAHLALHIQDLERKQKETDQ